MLRFLLLLQLGVTCGFASGPTQPNVYRYLEWHCSECFSFALQFAAHCFIFPKRFVNYKSEPFTTLRVAPHLILTSTLAASLLNFARRVDSGM